MRRRIISASTAKRIVSSINRSKRESYNNYLININSNNGDLRELPPYYELKSVDFDCNTRIAKL